MSSSEQLIVWVVLSPIAVVTCIACIILIAHYTPYYHGTDIALFSLFTILSLRVITVILIPAIIGLAKFSWSLHLCNFYVWMFVTLNLAEVLTFLAASIHWMTIPRYRTGRQIHNSAKYMKIVIFLVWFASMVIGLVPVIEWTSNFQSNGQCRFLPYNLGLGAGFSVFFCVINLFCFIMSIICTADTMILFKHMKQVAVDKYQAGRFYLPSSASVAKTATQTVHAKYNELNFSSDLCRLIIILIIGAFLLNHIPLTVVEFLQLVGNSDHEFLEVLILWLMLFEALILPHFLWFFSKRYHHALVYYWKVYLLKDPTAREEDPAACMLQSYTRKIRDVDGKTVRVTTQVNGRHSILPDKNQTYPNGDVRNMNGISVVVDRGSVDRNHRPNNIPVTVLDDGMVVANNNGASPNVVNGSSVKSRDSDPVSPSSSYLSTPQRDADLYRSSSSSSRKEWKEQMRRKHLPPIFVNEAFDDERAHETRDEADGSEFYVSSNYHPDYLMNSLPRSVHSVKAQESESEGTSNQYNDDDIDHILSLEKDQASLSSEQYLVMDISDDKSDFLERMRDEVSIEDPNETQTAADLSHFFREDSQTPTPQTLAVNLSDSSASSGSNASEKSVTIEPYNEARRPPWMDMEEETTSFQAPALNGDTSNHQDIDRGFDEALAAGYTSTMSGYGTIGLAFESIKEEPEDTKPDSPRSPYSPFKTQAVSTTRSHSPSQSSSENPFDRAPINIPLKAKRQEHNQESPQLTNGLPQLTNGSPRLSPQLTNGYAESITSFESEPAVPLDSPPLLNGVEDFFNFDKSPSQSFSPSDRRSIGSGSSQLSEEIAKLTRADLLKHERSKDPLTPDTVAYF